MSLKRERPDNTDKKVMPALTSKSLRSPMQPFMPFDANAVNDLTPTDKPITKSPDGIESDNSSEHGVRLRKKAEPVKSACVQCQKRKTKCSGNRPVCTFCRDRDLTCSWDIGDGMTRTADLKRKLQNATARSEDLDTLIDAMRCSSDEVSTMLLAKLRLGASVDDLLKHMRQDPSLTDESGTPSDATFSPKLSELYAPGISIERQVANESSSRPGTSTTSLDVAQPSISPGGSLSQVGVKQEPGLSDDR